MASSGDYGTAGPEYPPFSPNVVAVGGTTLNPNSDGSYQGETGWGYNTPAGEFIGSGGGVSQFESEPAYQQGVQSTSDLLFGGYDLGDIGQDSSNDRWLGASECSEGALGAYRVAFQAVLAEWPGP